MYTQDIQMPDKTNIATLWTSGTRVSITANSSGGVSTVNISSSTEPSVQATSVSAWTIGNLGTSKSWSSIAFGQTSINTTTASNVFVAVSSSNPVLGGSFATSTDGITFTSKTGPSLSAWSSICYAKDINIFTAIASSAPALASYIMTSSDGSLFTNRAAPAGGSQAWQSVCRANDIGLTLAVANNATTNTSQILISVDSVTWALAPNAPGQGTQAWQSVCRAGEINLFVAVAKNATSNTSQIMTSTMGTNWRFQTSPVGSMSWLSVAWAPPISTLVAVGSGSNIMTSNDAITWSASLTPITSGTNVWTSVAWSTVYDEFVTVSSGGPIAYSSDGVSWSLSSQEISNTSSWTSVVFGNSRLDRFVAVGSLTTNNYIYSTIDMSIYNSELNIGTVGTSKVRIYGSDVVIFNNPYYYAENSSVKATALTLGSSFTDIAIPNVPNGLYLCQIWLQNAVQSATAGVFTLAVNGSIQGQIIGLGPSQLIGGTANTITQTGPKYYQFVIRSQSSTGFQNISYSITNNGTLSFTLAAGILRTMFLQRVG
jgi:hypothetical protein